MSIVLQLRNALEFTRFSSPEIRDAYVACIRELDADLSEVNYEWTLNVATAFRELNKAMNDFENSEKDNTVKVEVEAVEVDAVDDSPDTFVVRDEVERVISAPSRIKVEVDDDDIDD